MDGSGYPELKDMSDAVSYADAAPQLKPELCI